MIQKRTGELLTSCIALWAARPMWPHPPIRGCVCSFSAVLRFVLASHCVLYQKRSRGECLSAMCSHARRDGICPVAVVSRTVLTSPSPWSALLVHVELGRVAAGARGHKMDQDSGVVITLKRAGNLLGKCYVSARVASAPRW